MLGITLTRLRAHPLRMVLTTVVVVLSVGFTAGTLVLADSLDRAAAEQGTPGAQHLEIPLLMLGAVALIVAAFVIANTFRILVAQRTRELALLRTVGATRRQVRSGVLAESAVVGTAGGAAGLALGALSAFGVGRVLDDELGPMPMVVSASTGIASLLVGLVVTVGSAVAPAAVATRVAPLAAVRAVPDSADSPRAGRTRMRTGVALIVVGTAGLALGVAMGLGLGLVAVVFAAAVCFLGILVLGPRIVPPTLRAAGAVAARLAGSSRSTVELATANAVRHPRRVAATSAALMIGVTIVIGFVTVAESARASVGVVLDERVPADFVIRSDESGGVPADAVHTIDDLPETGAAVELYTGTVDTEELGSVRVLGFDLQSYDQIARLSGEGSLSDVAAGDAAIDGASADAYRFGVGDSVTVDGRTWQVSYVVDDRTIAHEGLIVSPPTFHEMVPGTPRPATFGVDMADGESANIAYEAIVAATQAWPDLMVDDNVAAKEQMNRGLDQTVSVVLAILCIAVVIAAIGIANTLSLSVYERQREIGLLRALGLTRARAGRLLGVEAVLTALVGAVVGVIVGVVFAFAAVQSMERLVFVVPWTYIGLTVMSAALLGVSASIVPGRRAARTSPVAALATE